jgi:hypothetical protein
MMLLSRFDSASPSENDARRMPCFIGDASGADHFRQLLDPVIGQCGTDCSDECLLWGAYVFR